MMKIRLVLMLSLFVSIASAQLSVAVDAIPDSIYFGDDIILNYKINVPTGVQLSSVDFGPLKEIKNAAYEQDSTTFDEIMDVDIVDGGVFGINDVNLIISQQPDGTGVPVQSEHSCYRLRSLIPRLVKLLCHYNENHFLFCLEAKL